MYDVVFADEVAMGAYLVINIAAFKAGLRLALSESP